MTDADGIIDARRPGNGFPQDPGSKNGHSLLPSFKLDVIKSFLFGVVLFSALFTLFLFSEKAFPRLGCCRQLWKNHLVIGCLTLLPMVYIYVCW